MERKLAHIEEVAWVREIPAADNIELIGVLGWQCIQKKGETTVGDKVVYIEIDSLCPANDERFAFLEPKKYKVKTMKLGKKLGSPISQGLALPLTLFPELEEMNLNIGDDVTELLKITYYEPEDRARKAKIGKEQKYKSMMSRLHHEHPRLANSTIVRKLSKTTWGLKILFFFFGKKRDTPKIFPDWISKSDQTRVENMPWILEDKDTRWEVSEKLDGTSCSFGVKRLKNGKYDYAVCSRNVRQRDSNEIPYEDFDTNVYIEMSEEYKIQSILEAFATENNLNTVYIQGECVGPTIQGNPYKKEYRELYLFELVIDGQKQSYQDIARFAAEHHMKSVPIIETDYQLPDNMEEMKESAEGMSLINPAVKREGIVYRNTMTPSITFKNVSNSYILKHQG